MVEVVVTAAAEADYLEALLWYAERSQRAAEGFEAEFANALEQIAAAPFRFAVCDRRHRRFLMRRYPYQVVYRLEGDRIAVVAAAHAKAQAALLEAALVDGAANAMRRKPKAAAAVDNHLTAACGEYH